MPAALGWTICKQRLLNESMVIWHCKRADLLILSFRKHGYKNEIVLEKGLFRFCRD